MLLNDPKIYPDDVVLKKTLGKSYPAYKSLMDRLSGTEYNIIYEWRYYNDGKSWLCKAIFKKKTVFWLSAWEGHFRASFYFTERSGAGLATLDIAKDIKDSFTSVKSVGKLIPLRFIIKDTRQLDDFLKVVDFKLKQNK